MICDQIITLPDHFSHISMLPCHTNLIIFLKDSWKTYVQCYDEYVMVTCTLEFGSSIYIFSKQSKWLTNNIYCVQNKDVQFENILVQNKNKEYFIKVPDGIQYLFPKWSWHSPKISVIHKISQSETSGSLKISVIPKIAQSNTSGTMPVSTFPKQVRAAIFDFTG